MAAAMISAVSLGGVCLQFPRNRILPVPTIDMGRVNEEGWHFPRPILFNTTAIGVEMAK